MADYRKRVDPPAQYKNMLGDRSEKPMSVQMAEVGLEVATPLGTVNDIQAELEKDDPSYAKIAGMAGLELLGPAAGAVEMAAKAGNKGLLQKILGSFKKKEDDLSQIESDLEEQIVLDDINALMEEEGYGYVLTDSGVEVDTKQMKLDKENYDFTDTMEIQNAFNAGVLNPAELLEQTYEHYKQKIPYLGQGSFALNDAQIFNEVYEKIGPEKILKLAEEQPWPVLSSDDTPAFMEKLRALAKEKDINFNKVTKVVNETALSAGMRKNRLTERYLPEAYESGQTIYPKKPFEPEYPSRTPEERALNEKAFKLGFKDTVYHTSRAQTDKSFPFGDEFNEFKIGDEIEPDTSKLTFGTAHDFLGIHVGTARAAAERAAGYGGSGKFTMELRARLDKPAEIFDLSSIVGVEERMLQNDFIPSESDLGFIIDKEAENLFGKKSVYNKKEKVEAAKSIRQKLAEEGYTHIPYINSVEDKESVSYIMLVDRPKDSPAVLRDFRAQFDPEQANNPDLRFAEGGTVDMNEQMSFAFEDGGLRDDGMRKDPVSGNEVPSGSMAKEVRDDIPAQLSEGEYVVPADVVRYYGVKFFEDIRDSAKMGLRDMEARGRIGGEPVPAGGPMNNDDLSPEEMAAISEMMGMAQGGAVDMYKQQQNMYNPPAQAVGNPMQQMNAGGTVRGYNQAGSVTSQPTEQDMLNAADAVNQSRASGTGMMGAPLGFSIYRPQAEIDAEAQGAIDEVTPEPEKVTLYSPEGVPIELELPRDQATYDALLSQGYTTEVAAKTPQPRGSDDGGGGDDPTPDPTAWMKNFDYTNASKLAEQTSAIFDPKSPGLLGTLGIAGGALGAIGKMSNVAQANANIALLEAQGINTDSLKTKRDKYIETSGLSIIQKTVPGIMDGDQLKAQVEQVMGSNLFKNTPKPSTTPTPTPEPKPTTGGDDDGPTFTQELRDKQKEESTKATSLAKAKATGIAAQAKNQGKTIAEVSQTGSQGYGDESAASVATGGQGNQGLGSGAGGMNKGGLMATKPKRKTKRQYKKGGLAGKK